jgi:hypothetical protein
MAHAITIHREGGSVTYRKLCFERDIHPVSGFGVRATGRGQQVAEVAEGGLGWMD